MANPMQRLETERLILRPPEVTDAPAITVLAGHYEIARMTLNIPHPYTHSQAETFITSIRQAASAGTDYTFAITSKAAGTLMGCIGLHLNPDHRRAEMGYWIGVPYWNQGYTSEAARRMVQFGFDELALNRIFAMCFAYNPASARVMQKAAMSYEGMLRQHLVKWGEYVDVHVYSILRSEWEGVK